MQDLHCIQLGVYTFQSPALKTERYKELQRDIGESLELIRELQNIIQLSELPVNARHQVRT